MAAPAVARPVVEGVAVRPAEARLAAQRVAAARAAGCSVVYASAGGPSDIDGVRVLPVRHVREALDWAKRGMPVRNENRKS